MASSGIKIHSSEEVEYEGGNVHPHKATIAFQQAHNQVRPADLDSDEPSEVPKMTALTHKLKTVPDVPAKGPMTAKKPPAPGGRAGSNRFMPYARQKPTADRQVPVPNTRKEHQMYDMLEPFADAIGIPTAKPADRFQFVVKATPLTKPTEQTQIPVKKPHLPNDDMVSRVADLFGLFPADVYPGIPKMRVSKPYLLAVYCTALQKLKDSVAGPELSIWKNEKAYKFPSIPELQGNTPGTSTPNTSKRPVVPQLNHFTVPGVQTPTTSKVPKIPNLKHFIGPAVRKNKPFTGMLAEDNFNVPTTPTSTVSAARAMPTRKPKPVSNVPLEGHFKVPAVPTNTLTTAAAMPARKPKLVLHIPVAETFKVPAAPKNMLTTAPAMPVSKPKPFRGSLFEEHFKVPASRRNKLLTASAMPAKISASALNLDAPIGVQVKNQDQEGLRCLHQENPDKQLKGEIVSGHASHKPTERCLPVGSALFPEKMTELPNIPTVVPGNPGVFRKKSVVRRHKVEEFRGFRRQIRGLQYKYCHIQKVLLGNRKSSFLPSCKVHYS